MARRQLHTASQMLVRVELLVIGIGILGCAVFGFEFFMLWMEDLAAEVEPGSPGHTMVAAFPSALRVWIGVAGLGALWMGIQRFRKGK